MKSRHSHTERVLEMIEPLEHSFTGGRFRAIAKCECGREITWSANSMPAPDVILTKVRKRARGWDIDTKRKTVICHECIEALAETIAEEKAEELAEKVLAEIRQEPEQPPAPVAPVAPEPAPIIEEVEIEEEVIMPETVEKSAAARQAKRMVYALLEEGYDDKKKCYRTGWSDDKIADETGASVQLVAQVREEDFGPLGKPEELRNLEAQIASIADEASRLAGSTLAALSAMEAKIKKLQDEVSLYGRKYPK